MTRSSIDLSPKTIEFLIENNYKETEALKACREETQSHPRANYQIAHEQGAFMAFMTRLNDSRIAVEIGVFTGYSSLVTMNSMVKNAGPNAHLFALDMSGEYLEIAQKYWAKNLYIAFFEQGDLYIYPHDYILAQVENNIADKTWLEKGTYFQTKITKKFREILEPYKVPKVN